MEVSHFPSTNQTAAAAIALSTSTTIGAAASAALVASQVAAVACAALAIGGAVCLYASVSAWIKSDEMTMPGQYLKSLLEYTPLYFASRSSEAPESDPEVSAPTIVGVAHPEEPIDIGEEKRDEFFQILAQIGRGIRTEGLFRVNGDHNNITRYLEGDLPLEELSVYDCCDVFKRSVRLEHPLLSLNVIHSLADEIEDEDMVRVGEILDILPDCNSRVLETLFQRFFEIIDNERATKMNQDNLATIFSPVLLGEVTNPNLLNEERWLGDVEPSDHLARARQQMQLQKNIFNLMFRHYRGW